MGRRRRLRRHPWLLRLIWPDEMSQPRRDFGDQLIGSFLIKVKGNVGTLSDLFSWVFCSQVSVGRLASRLSSPHLPAAEFPRPSLTPAAGTVSPVSTPSWRLSEAPTCHNDVTGLLFYLDYDQVGEVMRTERCVAASVDGGVQGEDCYQDEEDNDT